MTMEFTGERYVPSLSGHYTTKIHMTKSALSYLAAAYACESAYFVAVCSDEPVSVDVSWAYP